MMDKRRHYVHEDKEFAAIVQANRSFRPRWRFLKSEREEEQDAYFWFLQGQSVLMKATMQRMNGDGNEQRQPAAQ